MMYISIFFRFKGRFQTKSKLTDMYIKQIHNNVNWKCEWDERKSKQPYDMHRVKNVKKATAKSERNQQENYENVSLIFILLLYRDPIQCLCSMHFFFLIQIKWFWTIVVCFDVPCIPFKYLYKMKWSSLKRVRSVNGWVLILFYL